MQASIQHGYLVLVDISGYTSFLAASELDHAPDILRSVLTFLIERLTPTLELAEVEGDAVFVYAAGSKLSRGELLLELIEATYVDFRDRQRTMQINATCPCKACQAISTLDLKFITHYGDYVLQDLTGTNKPLGSCVNLVHRLLKNKVSEATGWRGYALFTKESLTHMGVRPEGMHQGVETYEHLGTIETYSINLDERYQDLIAARRIMLTPEDADVVLLHDFSALPPVVWDWLNDPAKRTIWMQGSSWTVAERPHGRTGHQAQNHCATGHIIEQILDWRPFTYYTVSYRKSVINMIITGVLVPTTDGTRVQWMMKVGGALPRWLLRPLTPFIVRWVRTGMEKGWQTLERLMSDVETVGLPS